jgi:hypothetical protein
MADPSPVKMSCRKGMSIPMDTMEKKMLHRIKSE